MGEAFDCAGCQESLYGRRYIQVEEKPHCVPCYDRLHGNTCQHCQKLIAHNARELLYEDQHYHEECFRCTRCQCSLADQPFTRQAGALMCSGCYCSEFSSQCAACHKPLMPGSRKLEYGGSAWHEECFVCQACEQPIGSQAFIPDKDAHYCVPCFEGRFAPRCFHCKELMVEGGVTYKDELWHRECFVCAGCSCPLAGQAFTSQGDQPFCVPCFSSRYAQKCSACSKAITGFGEGKYVSFAERQWHQPCFRCSRCAVSLLGAGFFPDGDDILCKDCNGTD